MLDALAVLPQFWQFHREAAASGEKRVRVSPVLAAWLAGLGASRLLSFLSGVFNVLDMLPWVDTVEVFYSFSAGLNLLLLSEYLFYYVKSRCRGSATELPL